MLQYYLVLIKILSAARKSIGFTMIFFCVKQFFQVEIMVLLSQIGFAFGKELHLFHKTK